MKAGDLVRWKKIIPDLNSESGYIAQWRYGAVIKRSNRTTMDGRYIVTIFTSENKIIYKQPGRDRLEII